MKAPPRGRAGLAIPLVVALVLIAMISVAAMQTFRRGVTLQLDALLQSAYLQTVAEAALSEVADRDRLREVYAVPANLAALQAGYRQGTHRGGVLRPKDGAPVTVPPQETRARLAAERPEVEVGDVSIHHVEYTYGRRRGVMRFHVAVAIESAGKRTSRRFVQDWQFNMHDLSNTGDGPVVFALATAPDRRVSQ